MTNDGALGCAASHREVWKKAANTPSGMLIMEDDVITHPRLPELIDKHMQFFEKQDIVHFTLNTDSVLHVESPAGLRQVTLFAPRYPEEDWIKAALSRTNIETVGMWKLLNTFGMCCYFLSARGAEKLLEKVFPLRLDTTKIPLILQEDMPQYSLDRRMNALYQSLNAHMCMPFLAFTPNGDSTTRPADPLPEEEMADASI
jgi:GR25 family glycosyltransferase involved in LPS biosynthesis